MGSDVINKNNTVSSTEKQWDQWDKWDSQSSRKLSIKRNIKNLIHAWKCRDPNCQLSKCHHLKRIIQHANNCSLKVTGNCSICKKLITLCFYHAKYCEIEECILPICSSIKLKIESVKLQQRLQQAQQDELEAISQKGVNVPILRKKE